MRTFLNLKCTGQWVKWNHFRCFQLVWSRSVHFYGLRLWCQVWHYIIAENNYPFREFTVCGPKVTYCKIMLFVKYKNCGMNLGWLETGDIMDMNWHLNPLTWTQLQLLWWLLFCCLHSCNATSPVLSHCRSWWQKWSRIVPNKGFHECSTMADKCDFHQHKAPVLCIQPHLYIW